MEIEVLNNKNHWVRAFTHLFMYNHLTSKYTHWQ